MSKTWDAQFKPFADDLAALDRKITDWLADKTDRELMQIKADGQKRTSTNCWWSVYEMVPMVAARVDRERYRRQAEAALTERSVGVQDHVTGV